MSTRQERAELRRRTWTGGVASAFAEMDEASTKFWQEMTGDDRLGCVFDMWDEQMRLQDPQHEDSIGLQRAAGGVRPRRG